MNDICKNELVIGLPKLKFIKDKSCDACQKGKQSNSLFKLKNVVSTFRPLELIHMNLFGLTRVASLGGMHYAYVLVTQNPHPFLPNLYGTSIISLPTPSMLEV